MDSFYAYFRLKLSEFDLINNFCPRCLECQPRKEHIFKGLEECDMIKGRECAEIEMLRAFKSKRIKIWKSMNTSSLA